MKWARRFISLADEEWKVSKTGNYEKFGATFRKSFQVGCLWMELVTANTMRNDDMDNVETILYEFQLAKDIINIAKKQAKPTTKDFSDWDFYTAYGRKPLAYACSYLASNLHSLRWSSGELLVEVLKKSELLTPGRDDNIYPLIAAVTTREDHNVITLIAETYKLAAIHQLPDDKETAILWWGNAAHIAEAGGYHMGELRAAINKAIIADQTMDEDMFGEGVWKGSTYQRQSMLLARHYQDKPDDFILPRLERERRPDGNIALFVDGHVLCLNFDKFLRLDHNKQKRGKKVDEYFDTTDVAKEHGAES